MKLIKKILLKILIWFVITDNEIVENTEYKKKILLIRIKESGLLDIQGFCYTAQLFEEYKDFLEENVSEYEFYSELNSTGETQIVNKKLTKRELFNLVNEGELVNLFSNKFFR